MKNKIIFKREGNSFSLFFRDMKKELKSFIYWVLSMSLMILLLVLLYPAAIEKMNNIGDIMKSMPKELIAAFGLENLTWTHVLDYLSYEFQYILIAGCIYAGLLGAGIFSKEESNKTIQLIYSRPISRKQIFFSKVLAGILIILVYNILLFIITAVTLDFGVLNQEIDKAVVFKIYLGQFLTQLIFLTLGISIACLMKKAKSAPLITVAIVIFSYMLGIFSKLTESIKDLIYISPIHYFETSKLVKIGEFEFKYLMITIVFVLIGIFVSSKIYEKKDFNI